MEAKSFRRENIKMVVFDMAGTTVNENNIVYKTLRIAINKIGKYELTLDQVLEHGAGKEKLTAIKSILKNCLQVEDNKIADEIFEFFLVQLGSIYATEPIYPADNAEQLFAALKDYNLLRVLNTGYDRSTAESLLLKLNWAVGKDIDALVTASDVPRNRPYPDMIHFAMKSFGIENPESVIKIGDSAIDIEEGQRAKCGLSIGITGGAHTFQQLKEANPDFIIGNLLELLPILEAHKYAKV